MSSLTDLHTVNSGKNNNELRLERLKTDLSLMQSLGEVSRE